MSTRIIVISCCFVVAVIMILVIRKRQKSGKSVKAIFEVALSLLTLVSMAMFNWPKEAGLLMAPLPFLSSILYLASRDFSKYVEVKSEKA